MGNREAIRIFQSYVTSLQVVGLAAEDTLLLDSFCTLVLKK